MRAFFKTTGVIKSLVMAFALMLALMPQAGALGTTVAITDWFKIGASARLEWQISKLGGDGRIVQLRSNRMQSSRPLRRILVLYPRASSAYDTAMTKILSVFEDKRVDAEITVNMFGTDALRSLGLDSMRGKAALDAAESGNFDLVISMGSESTAWLWDHYRGGRLPVVSVCSKDPVLLGQMKDYVNGSGNNFAFTSLNMPIDAQMSSVMLLRPNLKNFAILVDSNNLSAVQTQAVPAANYARARGIRVFELAVKTTDKVRDELGHLVRDTVATMRKNDPELQNSLFWITGSTALFNDIATINAHAFRVPVLSTVTDVVKAGDDTAALSVGISFESNAYLAGLYAVGILEGQKSASEYPVGIVSPPDVAISFRKAREIGLRVPFALFEGATVIYDNDGKLVRSSLGVASRREKLSSKPGAEAEVQLPARPEFPSISIE